MPEVWPFFAEEVTETLSFLTDVLNARGAEQRPSLRRKPRQVFSVFHNLSERDRVRADYLVRSTGVGTWYVPLWHDAVAAGNISASVSTLTVDTSNRDFRDGKQVLIWQDQETYEVGTIVSSGGGLLNLGSGVSQMYTDAIVAPVLTGYAPNGLSITGQDTRGLSARIEFEITDVADLSASGLATYQSLDVVGDRSVAVDALSGDVLQAVRRRDSGLGPFDFGADEDITRWRTMLAFEDQLADRWARRQWLYSLGGRQKAFWVPTWYADLVPTATVGAGSTTLVVESIGPAAAYNGKHILVDFTSGTQVARGVTFVSTASGEDTLTLSSSLGAGLTLTNYHTISFLHKVRLDADQITLRHVGNTRTDVALPVVEVSE